MFKLRDMVFEDCEALLPCGVDEEARQFFDPSIFVDLESLQRSANDFFLKLAETTIVPPQIIEVDDKVVGIIYFCYLKEKDGQNQTELGFVLHKDYRGKGIVSQASKEMLDIAFKQLKVDFVCISCYPENLGSIGVAKKLGMSFDHFWESNGEKICLYKINKSEYSSIKRGV
jgi:RimJ/RimL family protein N-acetyltransferase